MKSAAVSATARAAAGFVADRLGDPRRLGANAVNRQSRARTEPSFDAATAQSRRRGPSGAGFVRERSR